MYRYALALCFCVNGLIVLAQDVEHETVIVKDDAMKTRLNVSKTIESVDGDFLTKAAGGCLSASLEKIPGLSSINIGSAQGKPVIRGLGFNRVAVVEDNVKHESQQWGSDHGLEIDQYAVEKAEILKGPSSLEYGSDALGGVVRISTQKMPGKNTFGASFKLFSKSVNSLFGSSVAFEGRKDKFFFLSRITYLDFADYKVPTDHVFVYSYRVPLKDGRLRNTAGREADFSISAGYIGKDKKLRLNVSQVNSYGGFFANAHGLEPRRVNENLHDKSSRDILDPKQKVNHLKTSLDFDKWNSFCTFSSTLAYQHNRREEFSPYVSHGYMPLNCPETFLENPDTEYLYEKDVLSANFKMVFPFESFVIKAGSDIEFQNNEIGGRCFIIPEYQSVKAGVFLSSDYTLNENWRLQGGLRYDFGGIKTMEYRDWFASEGQYVLRAENLQRTFNDFTFSCGVIMRRGRFSAKLNLGKGFRMPIAKELASNGVNYHNFSYEVGNKDLKSEKSYQLDGEIDYVSRLFTVTLTPFAGWFSNYIFLNPTPSFDRFYGNGNQIYNYTQCRVLRLGGEAEIKFVLDNRYSVFGKSKIEIILSGEYLKSRQLSGEKKGYSLPFSPPETCGLETIYTRNLKKTSENKRYNPKEFFVGLSLKKAFRQEEIVPPENPTSGYSVLNFNGGFSFLFLGRSVEFNVGINNIFNTVYYNHTSYYRLINVPEQGRNLTISLLFNI